MKNFISGILVGLLITLLFVSVVAESNLRLIINGNDVTATAEPIIHNGKTYTPARAVAEALGATVKWDETTRTVSIDKHEINENANIKQPVENDEPIEFKDPYHIDGYIMDIYRYDHAGVVGSLSGTGPFNVHKKNTASKYSTSRDIIFTLKKYVINDRIYVSEEEFLEKYNAYLKKVGYEHPGEGYLNIDEIREKYNVNFVQSEDESYFTPSGDPGTVILKVVEEKEWNTYISEAEFLEAYNTYLTTVDKGDGAKVEGYLTLEDISLSYNLGWLARSDSGDTSFRYISGIHPSRVVPEEMRKEAAAKGGEVIFVAGPEPGHVAFSIPWGEDWDYFKLEEMLVDESEFLEAYNDYLASKDEGVEGNLSLKNIFENYGFAYFLVSEGKDFGEGYGTLDHNDFNMSKITEATDNGGAVFFFEQNSDIAFGLPWSESWDYHDQDNIRINEAEFLEAYNAYLASREE